MPISIINFLKKYLKTYFHDYKNLAFYIHLDPLFLEPGAAPDKDGVTPIHWAAHKGQTEIVEILAPLTDNPNAPDKWGYTPIYKAAKYGCKEVVKMLAHLTNNPNAPNNNGETPSSVAKNVEIRKIIESFKNSTLI